MDKVLHKIVALLFVLVLALQPTSFVFAETTYTYGPDGQRTKMTVVDKDKGINTTTYYISNSYEETYDNNNPSAPPKIVKHTFANGAEVQTVFDSGKDAKTYDVLTDPLGNVTGLADSTGKLVETTDYYPFGAIRVDNKIDPAVPSSPNKFLDQKYDEQTGLNYLNARYYNSAIGRFISQDPVSLATPEKLLEDPQQLNFYSYARNNPITLSDPSGLETDVMNQSLGIPVIGWFGGHSTTVVNPESGEILYMDYNNVCRQITEPTTLAGYTTGPMFSGKNWRLVLEINRPDAISTYNQAKEAGSSHVAIATIDARREGMTNQQLDQRVLNNMVAMQGDQGRYNPAGMRWWSTSSNCHNTTTTLLERSGVSQGQVNEIGKQLSKESFRLLPGFGNQFSTPSVTQVVGQQISNTWNSIKQTFSNIISKIKH